MTELHYSVPDVSCEHCVKSISGEVRNVRGVSDVVVDLGDKRVTVRGTDLDDARVRAAIDEAGYEIAN